MALPRFYTPLALTHVGQSLTLDPASTRHIQVHRLQPSDKVSIFNGLVNDNGVRSSSGLSGLSGLGGAWQAEIVEIKRSTVSVRLLAHFADADRINAVASPQITLAVCVPANERMDWLVEKATELGAARIVPLQSERTVLRLNGERAQKRQAHWQAIAAAACAQCGRNVLPQIDLVQSLNDFLKSDDLSQVLLNEHVAQRFVLSLRADAANAATLLPTLQSRSRSEKKLFLSGPEGGLSSAEETAAVAAGFKPLSLGSYTLRAETAPLLALAKLI